MDIQKINEIKKLALIAMFSDDSLMEVLVLKGGNAIDLVYGISPRASIDLDFSIESDFQNYTEVENTIRRVLETTFKEHGYVVFDIRFVLRPQISKQNKLSRWGGYEITFKVIEKNVSFKALNNIDYLRKQSISFDHQHRKSFKIQISKYEYCCAKQAKDIDGYTIYVYTPILIVFEKLRSICQQMAEYPYRTTTAAVRARDFFDIYVMIEHFGLKPAEPQNLNILKNVFAAKDVALSLILKIREYREFHITGFTSLQDTLKPGAKVESFDYYFDYVVQQTVLLCQALGIE